MHPTLHFFFGQGWATLWYALIYLAAAFAVLMPLAMLLSYVKAAQNPGPGALGIFGLVLILIAYFAILTFIHSILFIPTLRHGLLLKTAFILLLPILVTLALWLPCSILGNRPSWPAWFALTFLSLASLALNLALLHLRATSPAASISLW